MPLDDHWIHCHDDGTQTAIGPIGEFLSSAVKGDEMDLRIEKCLEKLAVIAKRQAIAADLAALFGSLSPLYAAAAQKSSA